MYIWLAVNVDEQLKHLRCKAKEVTEKLQSQNSALTLPLHISLRISFKVDDAVFEKVVDRISSYFASITPFDIETKNIEKSRGIVWLKMAENGTLMKIHNDLVDLLQTGFGIPPHEFDRAYLFHVTFYMSEDASNADAAYAYLKDEYFPNSLAANKLVIGSSQTGRAGEYQVIKTFELKK